ncbi:MAG TPA: hypothetical protein VFB25_12055 [Gaiellaceae bacterium]|nr:hypothetical protein [Gaiellaceae bacterium]
MKRLLVVAVAACALWTAPGAFAATWCGSGETASDRPDIVAGPDVHAVFAIASDGADTFPAVSSTIETDVESISTWWQGQDPTRIPRFDTATFGATTCTDISVVHLPTTQEALSSGGADLGFQLVTTDLEAAGFDNPFKKYLVYYDGPPVQPDVCGTGAGDFASGPSFAVVWLEGCPGVPTDSISAHELLHALGALPAGAPHACPGDPGHPCDSPQDVLYPYNSGLPLAQLYLDYGHDDYYAHSGSWIDIQDSIWLHRLDEQSVALDVALTGAGLVTSDQPGLVCSTACATQWDPGSNPVLSARGTATTRFIRWGGACLGSADRCSLTLNGATSVTALFGPKTIAVRATKAGRGEVVCTPVCSTHYSAGRKLTMRAVPAAGWRFVRWSGACTGTAPVCRLSTDYSLAAKATFARKPVATTPKKR